MLRQRARALGGKAETRRHVVLEYLQRQCAVGGVDGSCGVVVLRARAVVVAMAVMMAVFVAAAEQQRARNIDDQAEDRDRDRLVEVDRHWRE